MDIAINKNIEYEELNKFLKNMFPDLDFFLIYEGLNDWDDIKNEKAIFQYQQNEDIEEGFKYGVFVHIKNNNILPLIEQLSAQISNHFMCAAFCDASRIVLKEQNTYYSLLFEQGKVYLVDDSIRRNGKSG